MRAPSTSGSQDIEARNPQPIAADGLLRRLSTTQSVCNGGFSAIGQGWRSEYVLQAAATAPRYQAAKRL